MLQPAGAKIEAQRVCEHTAAQFVDQADCQTHESVQSVQTSLLRHVFHSMQHKCGRVFTLDACTDDGTTALCPDHCSPAQPFLHTDCSGKHVWLNAPIDELSAHIEHYLDCKATALGTTSACILVPRWPGRHAWKKLLRGMQLLHEFPRGTVLYSAPAADGSRKTLPGLPWPAQVFYDPPKPLLGSLAHGGLAMQFAGVVSGQPAQLLFDTGASDCFVSASFVRSASIAVQPLQRQATLADGTTIPIVGCARLRVKVQGLNDQVMCLVTGMSAQFDVVLGESWLRKHSAVLSMADSTCSLRRGHKLFVLKQPAASAEQSGSKPALITAVQLNRVMRDLAARKQAMQPVYEKQFLVLVSHVADGAECPAAAPVPAAAHTAPAAVQRDRFACKPPVGTAARRRRRRKRRPTTLSATQLNPAHAGGQPNGDVPGPGGEGGPVPSAEFDTLLAQYQDVFPVDLPAGLPPDRGVGHTIPLEPDARPTFRPIYRLSPKEMAEVKRQVADLLQRSLIEPSTSPYGSPVLFVQKKDGSLRMCVDYRALNKQTVKNRYPMPRIDDLLDKLAGAKVFSSLDLQSAYNQVRITPEDVPKTAFRTPIGHYQFKVLCFGLTNAPATFQKVMDEVFGPHIGKFVLVYLDDILVFSKTPEEHVEHMRIVLDLLRKHKLYAKLSKCDFNQAELRFLGHIVGAPGVRVDPGKTALLDNWPVPKDVNDLRSFLGMANYFRRFVKDYAKMSVPLVSLLSTKRVWKWDAGCQEAFERIRHDLTHSPVLALPDFDKPFVVECDASDFAVGAVLFQEGKPVAYEGKKLSGAERNYPTHDRELLAVIHALRQWRCYLEGLRFTVVTDHNPLTWLQTQRTLSRRQARWSEYLQQFDFAWKYQPGKANTAADGASRCPGLMSIVEVRHSLCAVSQKYMAVLTRRQAKTHRLLVPAAGLPVQADQNAGQRDAQGAVQRPRTLLEAAAERQRSLDATAAAGQPRTVARKRTPDDSPGRAPAAVGPGDPELTPFETEVSAGYAVDPWFTVAANTAQLTHARGLWWRNDALVVPDVGTLRQQVLYECHDAVYSGHWGITKTLEAIERAFWWPRLRQSVERYVGLCSTCQRDKASNQKPGGLLQPLPIPGRRWEEVSMDFITQLPKTRHGHTAIVVFVDRLSKMAHFVPTTTTVGAQQCAELFAQHVWRLHGIPKAVVSDRDSRFTSHFWSALCELLDIQQNISTAFHPQTDGQTERVNRVLEDYLRHYVSPKQDDWDQHLWAAEFAYNNAWHESVRNTPFVLNYGEHPLTPASCLTRGSKVPSAKAAADLVHQAMTVAKACLQSAQQRQKAYADLHRRDVQFGMGDHVLLSTRNLAMFAPGTPKLMPKYVGPFKVLNKVGDVAYRLELPVHMKVHNVFHVSLLRAFRSDGGYIPPPPAFYVDGQPEFEVECLLKHRAVGKTRALDPHGRKQRLEYLVRWAKYGHEHDTWEPERALKSAPEVLAEYWRIARAAEH